MANSFTTPTRRISSTLRYDSVQLRDTFRHQRQRQLMTQSQPQFPWELLLWGSSAGLLLWTVTYMAVLPLATGVIQLLH